MGWLKDLVIGGAAIAAAPFTGGASLAVGAGLIGADIQGTAAKKAAGQIQAGAAAAQQQYAPYQQLGRGALSKLSSMYGLDGKPASVDLSQIPGYSAGLGAGEEAIRREAAAQGTRGGGTLASLFKYGQQYAGQAFQAYSSNLSQLAGMGLQGTQGTTGAIMTGAGAQASGTMGKAGAISGALNMGAAALGGGGGLSSIASKFGFGQGGGGSWLESPGVGEL